MIPHAGGRGRGGFAFPAATEYAGRVDRVARAAVPAVGSRHVSASQPDGRYPRRRPRNGEAEPASAAAPQGERRRWTAGQGRHTISSRIFVGNLSYETSQTELETLFGQVGQVTEVFLPVDRATEKPRGFAFVEFGDAASVPQAIEKLDGTELNGRNLRVSEARDRAPRPPMGPPNFMDDGPPPMDFGRRPVKPKGSRRGLRGRKRGF